MAYGDGRDDKDFQLAHGVYHVTPPTLTEGQSVGLQVDANGVLKTSATFSGGDIEIGAVEIKNGTDDTRGVVSTAGADAVSNTQNELEVSARLSGFNGTTWDRLRTAVTTVTSTLTGILNVFPTAKYNSTPPTLTDGQIVIQQVDAAGNLKTTLATTVAGEDITNDVLKVEQRFSFLNIVAGQATTVVKSGAGFLHSIVFNGTATATNTTTVYDNTAASGTVIAIPAATSVTAPTSVIYNCSFATGLTIITATANGANMTVIFR